MKRFISALALCSGLLVLLSLFLFPPAAAKENLMIVLLNFPAPPPPNPLVAGSRVRDEKFYRKSNVPPDGAPISDLLDYWGTQNSQHQALRYTPEMSDKVYERIKREIEKAPNLLPGYLNVFKDKPGAGEFVKEMYDREGTGGAYNKDSRRMIKEWLTFNSSYFSSDLARLASGVSDTGEYVTNQEELLALATVDYDKAQPIIDRLNAESSGKTSRVLAKWAQYRHAIASGSTGDADRYRDELKAIVEDRSALPGMRDLAMDALASEKEWPGRDEWYFSLLSDETLAELKVNGNVHTGLTTLILVSPDEKYVAKMIELAASDNVWVRSAAVRNLVTRLETGGPEVVKALLPWLEDPKWAGDSDNSRQTLVRKLSEFEIAESVPGLIKVLDEKQTQRRPYYGANAANMAANASRYPSSNANAAVANAMASALNAISAAGNRLPANTTAGDVEYTTYPFRYMGVLALGKQKDGRAVQPLRRILMLPEGENYERGNIVGAILASGGFSIAEQLAALETSAKGVRDEITAEENAAAANSSFNTYSAYNSPALYANAVNAPQPGRAPTAAEINSLLGEQLVRSETISDELARGIVDRVEYLDTRDAKLAAAYRRMILNWKNAAINILLLRDVKRGIADSDAILRLLSQRKELREKQSGDVADLRNGKPAAIGIASCIFEDAGDYLPILESGDTESKIALLACARLIRAQLPVAEVAKHLASKNDILAMAAERYLESEDSIEARNFVLAKHPGEAKILGATSAFFPEGVTASYSQQLWALYQSIGNDMLYNGWSGSGNDPELEKIGKDLREEIQDDDKLAGVYAYERNYIRIYGDRIIYSWDEDDSRYRERPLTKPEFDEIKAYLAANKVDELPPFLSCGGEYCEARELIMLGRAGGRRIYMNGDPGEFFIDLDKYFERLRAQPATLKYALSRKIPGLELLLATDDLHAETVWKEGADLRFAASETATRKKVESELEEMEEMPEGDDPTPANKIEQAREKRQYEGFGWYSLSESGASPSSQPPTVEFIPLRDGHGVQPADDQWKARFAGVEIRASADGLFKLARGRLTKVRPGNYRNVLVTPNGAWAVAAKWDDNAGPVVVRVNLATGKEFPVEIEGYGEHRAVAYITTLGKVLIARQPFEYEYSSGDTDEVPADVDPEGMFLLDAATGTQSPIAGEFRPLAQQTFRPLQKAAKPNEFWAAMPDPKDQATEIGIYDTKTFGFDIIMRIPKIRFNSMSMYVDEPAARVYFVYRGHLLALPLKRD